ncbi:EAL domain-containing protein [Marinobacter salicampi]|uniref:EAL domain-containing protein n=1 Tax=Marinobacter salicampi TaxID=435907 RepID=UPI00140BD6DD|nr:EAL domain-containing protein [Marinobacter salicampi]
MDDPKRTDDDLSQETEQSPVRIPIVGIGASAGGLEALQEFFRACPGDSGLAFVVVMHLSPKDDSSLAEILMKSTEMDIEHIVDEMVVEPDRIYVLQPNLTLTLENGRFRTHQLEREHPNLIIDTFFQSLARHSRDRSVGIVLSGTGTDGTEGAKLIREMDGLVMVQEPEQATFSGMPYAVINRGLEDVVATAGDMPGRLIDYIQHALQFDYPEGHETEPGPSETIQKIISFLSQDRPNDFTRYKEKTLIRRIYRRMGLCHKMSEEAYLSLLEQSEEEADQLYRDLLISVTAFFRDPEAMTTLDEQALARLVERTDTSQAIRIWVPGCATGEEAYTIAMLLHERLAPHSCKPQIQIFATDIDEQALDIARQGLYPETIKKTVPPDLLARYFIREGDYFRVKKEIREEIVFAFQNLITGAPFSQLDLVSCRNLLIYLKLDVQNQVMGLFHFALRDNGILFLGASETIGRKDDLFAVIDRRHRLYQRKQTRRQAPDLPFAAGKTPPAARGSVSRQLASRGPQHSPRVSLGDRVQRHLVNHFAPPAVLVTRDGEALYFVGETAPYLKLPTGEPSRHMFDMARGSVKTKLRTYFRQAIETGAPARSDLIRVGGGASGRTTLITVAPIAFGDLTHYLVVFEERSGQAQKPSQQDAAASMPEGDHEPALVRQLEDELQLTRAELHSTIEELETSNQELKVSHEEAISMNEELQSTNEELETSKEELQSLNEEMSTVNSELQTKVVQLDQAYGDLDNLLKSISSATLFIDTNSCIRLFTPNCKNLFNLVPTDVGRPLDEIKFKVDDQELLRDAAASLETLETLESEVLTDSGQWHLRRVSPYRTADNKIDGVVITYTNIDRLKAAQGELSELTRTLEDRVEERTRQLQVNIREREQAARERDVFFELSTLPFFVLSEDGYFQRVNPAWTRAFGWSEETLQQRPYLEFIHPDDAAQFKSSVEYLRQGDESSSISARFGVADGSYSWLEWNMEPAGDGSLLGVIRDVSEQMQSAQAVQRAEEELEKQVNKRTEQLQAEKELAHVTLMSIGEAVITTDIHGRVTNINPVAERLTGWDASQAISFPVAEVLELRNEATNESLGDPVSLALQKSKTVAVPEPAVLVRRDGVSVHVDASVSPVYSNQGNLLGAVAVFFDVSYARELTKRVRHRAAHDDLTGLINRGEFESRMQTVVASARDDGKAHALLFMDLDRFKIVNDTCGHAAGDELLRQISIELQSQVRQRDTLARIGGDEFALILENCRAEQALRIADETLAFMRNFRFSWEGKTFRLGISIGIALIDEHVASVRQVLHNADSACYMAKEAGRDRVYIFDENADEGESHSSYMYWASKVSQAMEFDDIELMAQPIVALKTGEQRGSHFEVLARLRDENGQMIPPANFINAAERYNLMPRLDRYVVTKVFKWLADNPDVVEGLDLCSINLSASTLGDDRFPGFLKALLKQYRIPSEKVCFEITETTAIRNLAKTIELAEEFKRLGFLFSLDDFGSGFASYHYLKRLPVDFLKIDGEFVRNILEDPMDEAMVRSMNEIGHIMGKKTIAEYVESESLLEKLKEIGVDYVQGFTIGHPSHLDPAKHQPIASS